MVKDFRRLKCLQNSMFATRILINEDVPQLVDFMKVMMLATLSPNNHSHMSHGFDALSGMLLYNNCYNIEYTYEL
ncbi:hypothetical protein OROMI_019444 [Orobanche minor]